jgi:hypothetical protein
MQNVLPAIPPSYQLPKRGESHHPRLTLLAMLAAADPKIANSLLSDPLEKMRIAHPHYALTLDSQDYATLASIRARAHTVSEFLSALAEIVDGKPT